MIVIHAGQPKAGSTTIQAFLSSNEDVLRRHSVDYPRAGRPLDICHRNIADEIQGLKTYRPGNGELRALVDYCHQSDARTIIVSAEGFESCETDQAIRLAELKRDATEMIRVVLIVRDLVSVMPTSYAQMVKVGYKVHDFYEFFEMRMRERRVHYFETARRWADAFGWENLRIRPLESAHLINGDLVDDFLCQAELDLNEPWVRSLQRTEARNSNPGWRVVEAMRALYGGREELPANHPLADAMRQSREQRRFVGRRGVRIGGKRGWNADRGFYLTREQAEQCLLVNDASIRQLNDHVDQQLPLPPGLDERGFVPRDQMPDASLIPRVDLHDFYDELGAAFRRADRRMASG